VNAILEIYEGAVTKGRDATGGGRLEFGRLARQADIVRDAIGHVNPIVRTARDEFYEAAEAAAEAEGKYFNVAHAMRDVKGEHDTYNSALEAGFMIQGQARDEAEATGEAFGMDGLGGAFADLENQLGDTKGAHEDYIDFILRMSDKDPLNPVPKEIKPWFYYWPTLFLGYSLMDYNLRLLFRTLRWKMDPASSCCRESSCCAAPSGWWP
jgi:hypothetical protein